MAKVGSLYVGICPHKGWGQRSGRPATRQQEPPSQCCVDSTPFHCSVLEVTAGTELRLLEPASSSEHLFERQFPLKSEFRFFVSSEGNDSFGKAEDTPLRIALGR